MNTITNAELEKGGLKTADLAAFAHMKVAIPVATAVTPGPR
jgi:hypothetical protein